jgi:hypothetical protein
MIKTGILSGAMAVLIVASSSAFAAGVSKSAPGHHVKGTHGSPGASYYAPGHEMQHHKLGTGGGPGGASSYAPGNR